MLSIRFDEKTEWWVSSTDFERLFRTAVMLDEMPAALSDWEYIACANGGMSIFDKPPLMADVFIKTMLAAARHDLKSLEQHSVQPQDARYRGRLENILGLFHPT